MMTPGLLHRWCYPLVFTAFLAGQLLSPVEAAQGKRPATAPGSPASRQPVQMPPRSLPAAAESGCKTRRDSGQSRSYRGCRFPGKRIDPPGSARAYLKAHGKGLGLLRGSDDLELIESKQGLASSHTRFRQRLAGYPVFQGNVSVHQGSDGSIQVVHSRYVPAPKPVIRKRAILTASRAELVARDAIEQSTVNRQPLRAATQSELVWFLHESGELQLAWNLMVYSAEPLGDFLTVIHAGTGELLFMENRMAFVSGGGYVYAPNPVQFHGNWTSISDGNDSTGTLLDSARESVILQGLDSNTGLLEGEFVSLIIRRKDKKLPDADEASRNYSYDRSDKRFEQVVVYHAVDSIQRYIHSLGFDDDVGIANGIRDFPTPTHAHWDTADQSFYSTSDDGIHFGDGGVDDAEDADIIAHEYGHAIQHDQNSSWGGGQMGAMGEGFGDYLAASFHALDGDSAYQSTHDACVGEWDATSYDNGSPPCLRRVDGIKQYPVDLVGQVHADGEIWSATLWDIRGLLGAFATDQLVLEHHFALPVGSSMGTAALAMVDADINLNAGLNEAVIRDAFCDRGIVTGIDCTITDDDNDGLSNDAEVALGTDPDSPHSDDDSLTDFEEVTLGTDPLVEDTDSDGYNDDVEVAAGSNPLDGNSTPSSAADGDVNGDGAVDTADLLLAMRILVGSYIPSGAEQARWDVAPLVGGTPSPDGQNNAGDYIVLLRKVMGNLGY